MIESELRDRKAMLKIVYGFDEWLDLRELKETAASLNLKLYILPSVPPVKFARSTETREGSGS